MRGSFLLIAGGLVSGPSFASPARDPAAQVTVVSAAELPIASAFEDAGGPVREVALIGVTRYAPAELLGFAVAHEHAARGRSTVGGTVEAIELIYREDGFLLAEARASFDPRTGRLGVDVVEGQVDELAIEGLRPKVARQVERYLRPVFLRRPLREGDFERAFMLASDLSGVYVRSEFAPAEPGHGTQLKISGAEDRGTGSFSVDNVPLRPDGAGRAYLMHEQRGLGVGGDMLRVFGSLTLGPGSDAHALAGTVFYRAPVGSAGTHVEAFAGNAFSSRQFAQVTPNSEQLGLNAAVAVGHPVRRNLSNYGYLIGEVEYASATSRTGAGELDSTTTAGRAYLVQGYTFSRGGLVQWNVELSAGVRPDRPAGQPEDGAREFFHARAGFGLVTGLPLLSDRAYLRFEAAGQWAGTRLPEVEQFGLGFQPRLRGYVPYEVEGDRGFASTLELSNVRPVAKGLFRELMPFAFAEAGGVETGEPWASRANVPATTGGGTTGGGTGTVPYPIPPQLPTQPPTPQQTPPMVPQPPTPQATPQTPSQVVPAGGSVLPSGSRATPLVIARPTPRTGVPEELVQLSAVASALITAPSTAQRWTAGPVTAEPGRQAHYALPTFRTPEGHVVQCLAGGYGWRYVEGKDGSTRLVGRVPVLRSTDVIVRDVPANHMMSPECAVVVKRRYDE